MPKKDVNKILLIIKELFNESNSMVDYNLNGLSVFFPTKFNRYFAYNLLDDSLSEIEFSKARTSNISNFKFKIQKWITQGLETEIQFKFNNIQFFDNREDFEKIILAIFYLASQNPLKPKSYYPNIIGYNTGDLRFKLSLKENRLVDQYYKNEGKEILQEFVRDIFKNAITPFLYEAHFIRSLNEFAFYDFPLSKAELKSISLKYLESYCALNDYLDSNVVHLFHSCKQFDRIEIGNDTYKIQESNPHEAKLILKNFVLKKDFIGFLKLLIYNPGPPGENRYSVNNMFIVDIFGSIESFKEILETRINKMDPFILEFKTFFEEIEIQKFTNSIFFPFKYKDVD